MNDKLKELFKEYYRLSQEDNDPDFSKRLKLGEEINEFI